MGSPFARFFIALWGMTIGKYPKGAADIMTSQRDLNAACGVGTNDISRFLAAMETCRLLTFTPASEAGTSKSVLMLKTEKLFDDKYTRAFMLALTEVLTEEIEGAPRLKNAEFAAKVKREMDTFLAAPPHGRKR